MPGRIRWKPILLFSTFFVALTLFASRASFPQSANTVEAEKHSHQPPLQQSSPQPAQPPSEQASPEQQSQSQTSQAQQPAPSQQPSGSISGTVVDQNGAAIAGARVTLTRQPPSSPQDAVSDDAGQFFFVNVVPGPFHLTIAATGFAKLIISGDLQSGQAYSNPRIALTVATVVTQVRVGPAVAEEQIKQEEQQRVLRVVPNFYVTYNPDALPLSPKQKFELAWKTTIDPVTFAVVGVTAGLEQAQNAFSGYGQGAQGYAKRYGAGYADATIGTFVGSAIFPSLLKQDPRYFYKGTGGTRARILYAIKSSIICKGDNGRWQTNYSNMLGNLAAGGLSNLYYPAEDRGVGLTFENALIGIGESAGANVLQEFLIPKLTPKKASSPHSSEP